MIFSEKKLVQNAKKSPEAFDKLYRKYIDQLYAFIASRCGTRQEAEDLSSDIWIKILKKIDKFEPEHDNSFRAWIFVVARNHLKDYYKHKSKKQDDLELSINIKADNPSPSDSIDSQIEIDKLKDIINTLPHKQAECVRLKYFA